MSYDRTYKQTDRDYNFIHIDELTKTNKILKIVPNRPLWIRENTATTSEPYIVVNHRLGAIIFG